MHMQSLIWSFSAEGRFYNGQTGNHTARYGREKSGCSNEHVKFG